MYFFVKLPPFYIKVVVIAANSDHNICPLFQSLLLSQQKLSSLDINGWHSPKFFFVRKYPFFINP
jgi:hypothetical protein